MAIVLTLPDDFDVENYTGLQSFLTDHLQLDSATVDQLPNLIRLAEYRLKRLIQTPERETSTTLSTTASAQAVTLPSDFGQARQLKINGSTGYPLEPATPNVVEEYDYAGKPLVYAISGSSLLLGPIPDDTYTLTLRYLAKLTALTSETPTNWLITDNADAYVYMAASVISFHLGDKEAAAEYASFADGVIAEINDEGNRKRYAAPIRLRSPSGSVV